MAHLLVHLYSLPAPSQMSDFYPLNVLEKPDAEILPRYYRKLMRIFMAEFVRANGKDDWQKLKDKLKSYLQLSLGTLPQNPTPIHPEVLGEIKRDGYVIQRLVFQSQPKLYVTANLYKPDRLEKPVPGILSVHGHFSGGKVNPTIQIRNISLAKKGYVVLCLDSIGSGERAYQGITYHGKHLGAQAFTAGLTLQGLQVWDNMRAIDYLQSLSEVDPNKIGCTGASGGGNQTYYLAAIDERVKAAVPVCGIGSYEGYLEGPCCMCEMIPHIARYARQSDILALIAPRPLLIISAIRDAATHFRYEDVINKTYPEVKEIYEMLGAGDKISLHAVDAGHGYDADMRQAMYAWFDRWLKGIQDPIPFDESGITPENPDDLLCTKDFKFPEKSVTVPSLTYETARSNIESIRPPGYGSTWLGQRELMKNQIIHEIFSGFPRRTKLNARLVDRVGMDGYMLEKMTYTSEGGIIIPTLLLIPKRIRKPRPLVMQIHPEGKEAAIKTGIPDLLVEKGNVVMLIDYRGTGETEWDSARAVGVRDYQYFQNSVFLGKPYVGMCVWDMIRGIDYMVKQVRVDPDRIAVIGNGLAGMISLFCGAIDERITAVACWDMLGSFVYPDRFSEEYPLNIFIPNVTKYADIAHVASLCAPRPLMLMNLLDGGGELMSGEQIDRDFTWTKNIYKVLKSTNNLQITRKDDGWEEKLVHWVCRSID